MHPTQTTRDTAQGHRLPIPKNLTVNNSQPIAVPPARPTLSGGMNNSGSQIMSTPAVTKPPAFEFDEGGMGLLNKRKLEELVKQIDPEEKLDPDVEEVCRYIFT
jgi:transcription initiation factor TFIID subunit 12